MQYINSNVSTVHSACVYLNRRVAKMIEQSDKDTFLALTLTWYESNITDDFEAAMTFGNSMQEKYSQSIWFEYLLGEWSEQFEEKTGVICQK